MTEELLPCPFCGGTVDMYYEGSHDWVVYCEKQGCGISHNFYIPHIGDEHAVAVGKWNTRAQPKYKRVDLDKMKYPFPNEHGQTYNRAIDDIKAKYGDLYVEVK